MIFYDGAGVASPSLRIWYSFGFLFLFYFCCFRVVFKTIFVMIFRFGIIYIGVYIPYI